MAMLNRSRAEKRRSKSQQEEGVTMRKRLVLLAGAFFLASFDG